MESSRAGDGHRECPAVGTGPDNQPSPVGEPSLRRDLRAGSAEDSERGGRAPPRGRAVIAKALSQGRVRRVRGTARSPDPPQGGDSVARGPCEVWRPRGLGPCREGPAT